MKNFARALRLGLRYKWTLAGTLVCSIFVAVLWGANIGTLYPIVEVSFKGQSLGDWVDEKAAAGRENVVAFETRIVQLEQRLGAAGPEAPIGLERELAQQREQLRWEADSLAWYEWMQPAIHRHFRIGPFQTVVWVIVLLLAGTLVKDLFLVAGQILVARLSHRATLDLRKDFYRRTLRMELASFGETGNADLLARFTNDMSIVTSGVEAFYGRAFREPLKMIVCLVGAALICWRLLVLTLVVVPLAAWLINRLAKSIKRASRRAMEEMSSLYNILVETFIGITIVKAFTMERSERWRFHLGSKEFYRKAMRIARYDSLVRPLTELMGILMVSMAILAGAYLVLNHETHILGIKMCQRSLSLASLMLFYALLAGVSDPARKLADVFSHLQRAVAASDRVYEILDREPVVADPAEPAAVGRHVRDLEFDHVDFHYQPGQRVLRDVCLRIPFGETLAVVGPNGCGKSTLAAMVARFYDPVEGSIRLDGIDLRQMRQRDLRKQIGLVTQEASLFDDTVLNNIRYGSPGASLQQAVDAARRAHADAFINEKLESGYDTVVGQGGGNLSGGQRQRVALARAILRDPAILILDEATSQIDLQSEQLIQKVLAEFVRDRTAIIVTHRLGILSLADRILVMEGGRVLDLGTHDELIGRCPLYQRLHQVDFRESA